jgi:hypothetical protein
VEKQEVARVDDVVAEERGEERQLLHLLSQTRIVDS